MLQIDKLSQITKQAIHLKSGMTYQEVVALLGRIPCTAHDEHIASKFGESVIGHGLISCEWRNDNPNCFPISVQFEPEQLRVTGWNDGRTCPRFGLPPQPFGEPFSEVALSEMRKRLHQ